MPSVNVNESTKNNSSSFTTEISALAITKTYGASPKATDLTHQLENNNATVRGAAMKEFVNMPYKEQMAMAKQITAINQSDLKNDWSLPDISIDFDNNYFTNKPQLGRIHLDYEPGTKNEIEQTNIEVQLLWDKGV